MHLTTKAGRKVPLPSDEEDAIITQQAIEDGTLFTDAELDQFKPFSELPVSLQEKLSGINKRGRPPTDIKKDRITIRLSPEVTDYFRATGKGWQTRLDDVLRNYVQQQQ